MRIPMIAGNWKMNTMVSEAIELVTAMLAELDRIEGVEKVVCPPFVSLAAIKEIIKEARLNSARRTCSTSRRAPIPERLHHRCWLNYVNSSL